MLHWLLIFIEWYRLERRVRVSENTSRSVEVEETFTVIKAPPPPHGPHPRHFPTPNSASVYLSCLHAESFTDQTFNLFCFIYVTLQGPVVRRPISD